MSVSEATAAATTDATTDATTEDGEATFRREVDEQLPRNYAVHLVHGLLGQTGFRIINTPTFLPAYVFEVTGATWLVGVARACQALGQSLTPIVGATLIEHRRKVLPVTFGVGMMMRLQVLGLALAGFFLGREANTIAICLLLGLFGFFTGMQSVTFSFLVSKVIPVERRGKLVGFRNFLAGLTASALGFIGGLMIDANTLGNGYASVFLVSFALTALGLLSMVFMREPESPTVRERLPLLERLSELPELFRSDKAYAGYFLARALGATGRASAPFCIVYAQTRGELQGEQIGLLTAAFLIASMTGNLAWGLIADKGGFRRVLLIALAIWAGCLGMLQATDSFASLIIVFMGLGLGFGGFQISTMNLVLEFGDRDDLPMRIAMANTGEQLVSVAAPLLGGLIIEAVSYEALFWFTMGLQAAAIAVTWLGVQEPRQRRLASPTR